MKRNIRLPLSPSPHLYRWFALSMADTPRLEHRLRAILSGDAARPVNARATRQTRVVSLLSVVLAVGGLAIIHPTRGQAKRPSPPQRVTPTSLSGDPERVVTGPDGKMIEAGKLYPLPYNTAPMNPKFSHKFPGGLTIDLAGVAEAHVPRGADSNLEQYKTDWKSWTPAGASLPTLFIDRSPNRYHDGIHNPPPRVLAFAFRMHPGNPRDIDLSFKAPDNAGFSGYTRVENSTPEENWREGGFTVLDAAMPRNLKSTKIWLGVAEGPYLWSAVGALIQNSAYSVGFWAGTPAQVRFGSPIRGIGRTGFLIADTVHNCQTRIFAVDRAGKQFAPDEIQDQQLGAGDQDSNSRIVWFDEKNLPFARLASLRLEARPYHWEAYDHIALNPK